jgi:hypothetical protein
MKTGKKVESQGTNGALIHIFVPDGHTHFVATFLVRFALRDAQY